MEIHPFLHRFPEITRPTSIVFHLDPGEGAGLVQCCTVAKLLQRFFRDFALEVFAKISGLKGMQVYLPLNTPITYTATQAFARRAAEHLARKYPELIVAESAKTMRPNRVLIDWAQNSQQKSNVAVYSVRAGDEPLVSMPLDWHEVETAAASGALSSARKTLLIAFANAETCLPHCSPCLKSFRNICFVIGRSFPLPRISSV